MATSYNGWYASPTLPLRPLVVAGESFIPGIVDDDDVYTVLQYVAEQMHLRVEPIVRADWHQADDWGFNYRETTNDTTLSCHASGTAIDYNATRHPYGVAVTANFTTAQIATIHDIIDDLPIIWGGDYRYSADGMHFEIAGNKATVAAAAARIRNIGKEEEDEMKQEDFERIRQIVRDEIAKERDNLRTVVREETDASNDSLLAEQVEVTTSTGGKRTMSLKQLLRETWQRLAKHT